MPTLHEHPDTDETFHLLEGEVRLHIAGAEQTLAAGGIADHVLECAQDRQWRCEGTSGNLAAW